MTAVLPELKQAGPKWKKEKKEACWMFQTVLLLFLQTSFQPA
jgi:hypothetical protein